VLEILVTNGIKTRVANQATEVVAAVAVEEAVEWLTAVIVAVGIVSREVK